MNEPIIIPLKRNEEEVEIPKKQTITPLRPIKPEASQSQQTQPKEVSIQEYVDLKCQELSGGLVGFITNWVQTTFASNLIGWLKSDFKNEIKQELIKELKTCN